MNWWIFILKLHKEHGDYKHVAFTLSFRRSLVFIIWSTPQPWRQKCSFPQVIWKGRAVVWHVRKNSLGNDKTGSTTASQDLPQSSSGGQMWTEYGCRGVSWWLHYTHFSSNAVIPHVWSLIHRHSPSQNLVDLNEGERNLQGCLYTRLLMTQVL